MSVPTKIVGPDGQAAFVDELGQVFTRPVDFHHEVSNGTVLGHRVVQKFGRATVGTTFVPVAFGGAWQTPLVSSATALRVAAGNVNDAQGGTGARSIILQGIATNGQEVTSAILTNGTSPGAASAQEFCRLYRAFVEDSGTYATVSPLAASQAGDITIENAAGGTTWAVIDSTNFARSQTEIACYTVPANERALIPTISVTVDATKSTDILFFQRQNIIKTTAPFPAMRLVNAAIGISGPVQFQPEAPVGGFPPLTDFIFLAKVAQSTGAVIVNFEILLEAA